jgi:hypothetical protein
VVCFEFSPPTGDHVLHSAVSYDGTNYFLPPLTLLEVVHVERGCFDYLGKPVYQDLITVRPTYLLPSQERKEGINMSIDEAISKFAADRTFLSYGSSMDSIRGLTDITNNPVLTMAQEFARNDQWVDWRGTVFSAWKEWTYVINPVPTRGDSQPQGTPGGGGAGGGPAKLVQKTSAASMGEGRAEEEEEVGDGAGVGVGLRDPGRAGWDPAKFREVINGYVMRELTRLSEKQEAEAIRASEEKERIRRIKLAAAAAEAAIAVEVKLAEEEEALRGRGEWSRESSRLEAVEEREGGEEKVEEGEENELEELAAGLTGGVALGKGVAGGERSGAENEMEQLHRSRTVDEHRSRTVDEHRLGSSSLSASANRRRRSMRVEEIKLLAEQAEKEEEARHSSIRAEQFTQQKRAAKQSRSAIDRLYY